MTIVTGDIHGRAPSLSKPFFTRVRALDSDEDISYGDRGVDTVIVAGDFGIPWYNPSDPLFFNDKTKLDFLQELSFDIVVTLGNHENYDYIESLPIEEKYGNPVYRLASNIVILQNGYDYTINDHHILNFGGADSIDKQWRTQGQSWWSQEIPTQEQFDRCIATCEKYNYTFDYVITHTVDDYVIDELRYHMPVWDGEKAYRESGGDPTGHMIAKFADKIKCKAWIFGHFHVNRTIKTDNRDIQYVCLYDRVYPLGGN